MKKYDTSTALVLLPPTTTTVIDWPISSRDVLVLPSCQTTPTKRLLLKRSQERKKVKVNSLNLVRLCLGWKMRSPSQCHMDRKHAYTRKQEFAKQVFYAFRSSWVLLLCLNSGIRRQRAKSVVLTTDIHCNAGALSRKCNAVIARNVSPGPVQLIRFLLFIAMVGVKTA